MFFGQWVSRPHYERYLAWRTETGTLNELAEKIAGEPIWTFYDYVGA
jgi:hypothetical protein